MLQITILILFALHSHIIVLAQKSISKSYGPPAFFLQDPNDGLCLAGSNYKRCGLDTLWYVSGKQGSYQIHRRLVDDDDIDQCLDKAQCHLSESELVLGSCNHCGAKKWNILGDAQSGYVLTENNNEFCVKRTGDVASVVKCDKGYSGFNLQFVTKEDITTMSSDGARLIVAASENDLDTVKVYLNQKKIDVNACDWDNLTSLIAASGKGYLDMVKYLVSRGADVNHRDKDNVTAVLEAARSGSLELVKFLVSHGADVTQIATSGVSALWLTAGEGHVELVEYLLSHGANASNERTDGITALMAAAAGGHYKVAEILVNAGASVMSKDKEGLTALISASENGSLPLVKLLLEHGSDVNAISETGFSPLIIAAAHGHADVARAILERGAPVDADHPDQVTPLMYACAGGYVDVVKLLIERGADVNAKHKHGGSALMEAGAAGNAEVVQVLLEAGADAMIVDKEGTNALMTAASQGNVEICKLLLAKGLPIDYVAHSGGTAIMYAALNGQYNVTKLLVDTGADVNVVVQATADYIEAVAKDIAEGKEGVEPHKDGVTTLMLAAQGGFQPIVELLVENTSAEINVYDDEDMSPLIYAIKGNHYPTAIYLLKHGANGNDILRDEKNKEHNILLDAVVGSHLDLAIALVEDGKANVNVADEDGITPLIQSSYLGLESVVRAILTVPGVNISAANAEGVNALIAASSEGHIEIIKALLAANTKIDVNARDKDNTNALMAAAVRGHREVVSLLLSHGADVNAQNVDGHTALMFAYNGKNQVETLLSKYTEYIKLGAAENSTKIIQDALNTHIQVVAELINAGADVNLKDNEGHIAIDFDFKANEDLASSLSELAASATGETKNKKNEATDIRQEL